jgi:predicted nuclease of predicted toxin-antitoxin system
MKLVVDMNLSPQWAGWLRGVGHEAVHWCDIGAFDAADATILAWARDNGFIVLTQDLDFGAILAVTGGSGPSVVQLRAARSSTAALGPLVADALRSAEEALLAGALVTIDDRRHKVSLLPLPQR